MEILLVVFTGFCRCSRGAFCRKSPSSAGRKGVLKTGMDISGITQNNFRYNYFDIQGAELSQTPDHFIDSPDSLSKTIW